MSTSITDRSWVASANLPGCDFPLANLPLCVFRSRDSAQPFRPGVGIGDQILALEQAADQQLLGPLSADLATACRQPALNALFSLGRASARLLRAALQEALAEGSVVRDRLQPLLLPQSEAEYGLPCAVGDYTDFFTSLDHATNIGRLFRPDNPVFPNFTSLPVAYHSRSSSLVISGTPVRRPSGQFRIEANGPASFGPSRKLDLEMEIGAFIGRGNPLGQPVPLAQAEDHVAGLCLVNDWSARDIQAWEAQPLGPFLSKNFSTSLSSWVVTIEALEPYREPARPRQAQDQPLLAYLDHPADRARGAFAIHIETHLRTASMREQGLPPERISAALYSRDSYWTLGQMVAQHTVNGCNLRSGDLIATGTLSGPGEGTQGCLMELTRGGAAPLTLRNGETRSFLEDGDEIILSAYCGGDGKPRIGFGSCSGVLLAATAA